MNNFLLIPYVLGLLLLFIFGFVFGQSIELGWGLPVGTSLTGLIAALALVTTFYHSYAVRKHNRLQVKPFIRIHSLIESETESDKVGLTIKIKNVGLGPAIIDDCLISFKGGDKFNTSNAFPELVTLVNEKLLAKGKSHCKIDGLKSEDHFDKGEEKVLISVYIPRDKRNFMEYRDLFSDFGKEIQIQISYKSHYGEKFSAFFH